MAYIIDQLDGDFQKPTSGIQWTPKHSFTSDRPQRQASTKPDQPVKFGIDVLAITHS